MGTRPLCKWKKISSDKAIGAAARTQTIHRTEWNVWAFLPVRKLTGKTFRRNGQNNSSSRAGKSLFTLLENTHTNPGSKNFSVPINLHPHHSQVKRRLLIRQFSWLQINIYLRLPRMNSQWHNYADKLPVTVAGPRRLIPASLLSLWHLTQPIFDCAFVYSMYISINFLYCQRNK